MTMNVASPPQSAEDDAEIDTWRECAAFLEELEYEHGVRCELREGRLVLRPVGIEIGAEIRERLLTLRSQLRAFITAAQDFRATPPPSVDVDVRMPLSFGQLQMYRTIQIDDLGSNFLMTNVMRVRGAIDLQRLCASVGEVVGSHDALRVHFVVDDSIEGGVAQVLDRSRPVTCEALDWRSLPRERAELELEAMVTSFRSDAFDLTQGPLYRLAAVQISDEECWLLMTFHHLLLDDLSMRLLHDQIASSYAGRFDARKGHGSAEYWSFVAWQAALMRSAAGVRMAAYWEWRLKGMPPVLELPLDRPRPLLADNRCAAVSRRVEGAVLAGLLAAARQSRTSLFTVLLAAFAVLMWRLSLRRRLPIATLVANRDPEAFERTVGLFFNTVILGFEIDPDQPFLSLVEQASVLVQGGLENGSVPFMYLVERLCRTRDPTLVPLAQVLFSSVNDPVDSLDAGGATVRKGGGSLDLGSAYDTHVMTYESSNAVVFVLQYRTCLLDEGTAHAWLNVYINLLASASEAPDKPLRALRLADDTCLNVQMTDVILDEWQQPLPPGLVGYLYSLDVPEGRAGASGSVVAVPTGRLGRRCTDGRLEVFHDDLLAIGDDGKLADVPAVVAALKAFAGVADAALDFEPDSGLVAYVVPKENESIDCLSLRRHLFASLPPYLVPARLRRINVVPLLVGGGVDRPGMRLRGAELVADRREPVALNERQAEVLRIWESALRITDLGPDDDFFAIGGNSLTGTLIVAAVNRRFRCKSSLRDLFAARTVLRHAATLELLG